MALSRYVIETIHAGHKVLYNTVTKRWLGHSASEEELAAGLFLVGQERQAILRGLGYDYSVLGLVVVPSWECNLRCKHCSVLTLLQEHQSDVLDVDKLARLAEDHTAEYGTKYITLDFVGGEPLLRAADCLKAVQRFKQISGVGVTTSLTTNATLAFTDVHWELLDEIGSIAVSIDGSREQHNGQRIPLHHAFYDPYQKTVDNLDAMLDRGYADKLHIKSAIAEQHINKQDAEAFLRKFAYMGIKLDHINYGCHHPTDHTNAESLKNFQRLFLAEPIPIPCCKYRRSSVYLIEANGDVYDVPFKWARDKLGTLDDNIKTITARREQLIQEKFVCFQDETCMKCPVLGYCWGGCVTGDPLHKGKPSEHCHQQRIIDAINSSAKDGTLISSTKKRMPLEILSERCGV